MQMNPETNRFETLPQNVQTPEGWIEFVIGEEVELKNYRFKIKRVSAQRLVLEPLGALCTAVNRKSEHP